MCEVGLQLAPATAKRPAMSEYFIAMDFSDALEKQEAGSVEDIVLAYTP